MALPCLPGPRRGTLIYSSTGELGAVGTLPECDDQRQRTAVAIRTQVDLAGEASTRAAQALASLTTSTSRTTRLSHPGFLGCSAAKRRTYSLLPMPELTAWTASCSAAVVELRTLSGPANGPAQGPVRSQAVLALTRWRHSPRR